MDGYAQVKLFAGYEDNTFCSEKCFCEAMVLEEISDDFYINDEEYEIREMRVIKKD